VQKIGQKMSSFSMMQVIAASKCADTSPLLLKTKKVSGTIFVVVPFVTSVAKGKLETLASTSLSSKIKVSLHSYKTIPTVKELMTESRFKKLCEIFPDQLMSDKEEAVDTGIGMTYFQHKAPNGSSFLLYAQNILPPITPPYIGGHKKEKKESKVRTET
jgi:hypothetical protein